MLLLPQDAVLMEVKLPGVCPLWLSRALSELFIYQTSFTRLHLPDFIFQIRRVLSKALAAADAENRMGGYVLCLIR